MAPEPVRLEATLQPEAADQLEHLARQLGANRTTALHSAIALADLLYQETSTGGKVTVRNNNVSKTIDLPKVDQREVPSAIAQTIAAENA